MRTDYPPEVSIQLSFPAMFADGEVAAAFDNLVRTINQEYPDTPEELFNIALVIPPPKNSEIKKWEDQQKPRVVEI
jgi:hypothetical protein